MYVCKNINIYICIYIYSFFMIKLKWGRPRDAYVAAERIAPMCGRTKMSSEYRWGVRTMYEYPGVIVDPLCGQRLEVAGMQIKASMAAAQSRPL